MMLTAAAVVWAEVNPHQAEQIRQAAPEKARVAPKKPRTVLIFNAPAHLMPKDPHKGYCIPFGQCALKTLGERTGAFTPVVSDDFALAWVKPYGKGRVFNTSFGHRTELFWNPQLLQFCLDAVQFATGDLDAPVAPRNHRPDRDVPGTKPAPGLEPGFMSLSGGRDLAGWQGDPQIWSVVDGAITGRTTAEVRLKENNFLVWKDEVEDFELRLKFKLEGGNSGIYYRARKRPPHQTEGEAMVGTQADFDASGRWTGVIMEYTLRDVLAERGQKVVIDEDGTKLVTGSLGDPQKLLAALKPNQWNDYTVVARGGHVSLAINGVPMCELDDRDPNRLVRGWLALQVHVGAPMRVQFKDIYLRRF